MGLLKPILVGPKARIEAVAAQAGIDLSGCELVDAPHSHGSAETAVRLAREGKAEMLMKGSLHTDELMAAVVKRETGLRTGRRISHCFIMDVPAIDRVVIITDAAVNIFPTLVDKVHIVQNAIDLRARARTASSPKVAILSAMETVNPQVPSTIEAAALCKMAERGQITGGVLDGPLALDNAIDLGAARIKKHRLAGGGPGRHPRRARPRGRQHAGQEPVLHGRRRRGGHRARRARADHPDQPRRLGRDAARRRAPWRRSSPRRGARARRRRSPDGEQRDAIVVLNAGSSSIKFSLFAQGAATTWRSRCAARSRPSTRAPRFIAKDAAGETVATHAWPEGTRLGHEGALEHIVAFLRSDVARAAAGRHRPPRRARRHEVRASRCASIARCSPIWRSSCRSRRCTSRTTWSRSGSRSSAGPSCRRWPASTPRSTAHSPSWRRCSRCRGRCTRRACGATAFTACRTSTSPRCCRSSIRRGRQGPHRRPAPRQRREHVRARRRAQCREHDGLHRRRRAADGHALRRARPRRVLYLMEQRGMDARAIEKLIYSESGLLGVSGVSSDMRDAAGERARRAPARRRPVRLPHRPRARLARRRARRARCDRLHRRHRREQRRDPRARVPRRGLARRRRSTTRPTSAAARASAAPASTTAAFAVPTNEELMIARHTQRLLAQ